MSNENDETSRRRTRVAVEMNTMVNKKDGVNGETSKQKREEMLGEIPSIRTANKDHHLEHAHGNISSLTPIFPLPLQFP